MAVFRAGCVINNVVSYKILRYSSIRNMTNNHPIYKSVTLALKSFGSSEITIKTTQCPPFWIILLHNCVMPQAVKILEGFSWVMDKMAITAQRVQLMLKSHHLSQ